MPTNHPYDLVIGLDRSDRKVDLHLIDTRTGNAQKQTVATSPEALHAWLAQLRLDHPQERVAICLEQPAANLIVFLETYSLRLWSSPARISGGPWPRLFCSNGPPCKA